MLRALDPKRGYKPKDKKDMSQNELDYLARAKVRDEDLQLNAALQRKQREDAKKAFGI